VCSSDLLKTAVLYHVQGVPGAMRKRSEAKRPAEVKGEAEPGDKDRARADTGAAPLAASQETPAPRSEAPAPGSEKPAPRPQSSPSQVADIAASFQAAVVDVLRLKLRRAAQLTGARSLIVGGGVAANSALRQACEELARKLKCSLRLPQMKYCGDNAAMVAGLGWHLLRAGSTAGLDLEAFATVKR
jgi:hypothetical protein